MSGNDDRTTDQNAPQNSAPAPESGLGISLDEVLEESAAPAAPSAAPAAPAPTPAPEQAADSAQTSNVDAGEYEVYGQVTGPDGTIDLDAAEVVAAPSTPSCFTTLRPAQVPSPPWIPARGSRPPQKDAQRPERGGQPPLSVHRASFYVAVGWAERAPFVSRVGGVRPFFESRAGGVCAGPVAKQLESGEKAREAGTFPGAGASHR